MGLQNEQKAMDERRFHMTICMKANHGHMDLNLTHKREALMRCRGLTVSQAMQKQRRSSTHRQERVVQVVFMVLS